MAATLFRRKKRCREPSAGSRHLHFRKLEAAGHRFPCDFRAIRGSVTEKSPEKVVQGGTVRSSLIGGRQSPVGHRLRPGVPEPAPPCQRRAGIRLNDSQGDDTIPPLGCPAFSRARQCDSKGDDEQTRIDGDPVQLCLRQIHRRNLI